jgi:hypothetical protein
MDTRWHFYPQETSFDGKNKFLEIVGDDLFSAKPLEGSSYFYEVSKKG